MPFPGDRVVFGAADVQPPRRARAEPDRIDRRARSEDSGFRLRASVLLVFNHDRFGL